MASLENGVDRDCCPESEVVIHKWSGICKTGALKNQHSQSKFVILASLVLVPHFNLHWLTKPKVNNCLRRKNVLVLDCIESASEWTDAFVLLTCERPNTLHFVCKLRRVEMKIIGISLAFQIKGQYFCSIVWESAGIPLSRCRVESQLSCAWSTISLFYA